MKYLLTLNSKYISLDRHVIILQSKKIIIVSLKMSILQCRYCCFHVTSSRDAHVSIFDADVECHVVECCLYHVPWKFINWFTVIRVGSKCTYNMIKQACILLRNKEFNLTNEVNWCISMKLPVVTKGPSIETDIQQTFRLATRKT